MCIASILFDFLLMAYVETTTGRAKKQLGLLAKYFLEQSFCKTRRRCRSRWTPSRRTLENQPWIINTRLCGNQLHNFRVQGGDAPIFDARTETADVLFHEQHVSTARWMCQFSREGTRTVGFLITLPCRRMCPLPFSCIYA